MNHSNLQTLSDDELLFMFKGIFRDLAPIQIPLSIIVVIQNTVIFIDYYKDRAKFVSSLFMGIAFLDILKAQGQLILAVISLLVYAGYFEPDVLYKALFYYMVTALPGINCSKLFNMILTFSLTFNIVNPFRVIDTDRLRKVVRVFSLIITLLHFADALTGIIVLFVDKTQVYHKGVVYLGLILAFEIPGFTLLAVAVCYRDASGYSACTHKNLPSHIIATVLATLYFFVLPLTVLICMVIQVKYLKRSLREEGIPHIPNTSRHVSITVFLVSTLFFFCNVTYFFFALAWAISHRSFVSDNHPDHFFEDLGRQVGVLNLFKIRVVTCNNF